ncbi:MAG TPA: Uma2 family endonuclease [Leptolyngbyaceae cyanobacterium M33_DOE_097]|nr:Uma2 family endonuclease [Leptolyngbyaceae cyanobacterium M33_DOE_097]
MVIGTKSLTLEAFLQLPETKPASEFIGGQVSQKPMLQGEHSRLQGKLCEAVNRVAEPEKIAYAFPGLRCTFGGASVVPDIAVVRWERIPRTDSGRVANRFNLHPDWAIEILSPDQSQTKVLGNLLHCSEHGTELGWLIDPEEETVLIVLPEQRVRLLKGTTQLPILSGITLELTVEQVFGWLVFLEASSDG